MQARVLRTMDKVGGLDEYLMGEKPARIKELGVEGWRLRWMVMRRRVRGQKEAVGGGREETGTEGAEADPLAAHLTQTTNTIITTLSHLPPSSDPPAPPTAPLISRLDLAARSIRAETARRASSSSSFSLPPQSPSPLDTATATHADVSKLQSLVLAEMQATEGEESSRLVEAMERLCQASEELEAVKAEADAEKKVKGPRLGMGMEKEAEGGILGKIKGFFGRR